MKLSVLLEPGSSEVVQGDAPKFKINIVNSDSPTFPPINPSMSYSSTIKSHSTFKFIKKESPSLVSADNKIIKFTISALCDCRHSHSDELLEEIIPQILLFHKKKLFTPSKASC
jgi:hypothetical protein